jgi:hypothetical protein
MNDEQNYQQREHLYRVCVCLVLLCVCTLFCYVLNKAENSRELNHGNRRGKKKTPTGQKRLGFQRIGNIPADVEVEQERERGVVAP